MSIPTLAVKKGKYLILKRAGGEYEDVKLNSISSFKARGIFFYISNKINNALKINEKFLVL